MSTMYTDHPSVLLPAFVLSALEYDHYQAVELHLRYCQLCQLEVHSLRQWLLSDSESVPRPKVRSRLLARVAEHPPEYRDK